MKSENYSKFVFFLKDLIYVIYVQVSAVCKSPGFPGILQGLGFSLELKTFLFNKERELRIEGIEK